MLAGAIGLITMLLAETSYAQVSARARDAASRMRSARGAPLAEAFSPATGLAVFVGATRDRPIPMAGPRRSDPVARARGFLDEFGTAFGLSTAVDTAVLSVSPPDEVGIEHVRLRQLHAGLPVSGAELSVHLSERGVVAAHAQTMPPPTDLSTRPAIDARTARRAVADWLQAFRLESATLSEPELQVFNRQLFDQSRGHPTRLAWFVIAAGDQFYEYVWIDAETGALLLHFDQAASARNRLVYDNFHLGSLFLPGFLVRQEGEPPSGDVDADLVYEFAGDTYDYFLQTHGRDSYDGFGSPIVSSVHLGSTTCPNAMWLPDLKQVAYCDGMAADDVVAHEITHAVTETTAALFYYRQSGALNESFSDIFGETVDIVNGAGTDGPELDWFIGEDSSLGIIRDMLFPNDFGQPESVVDPSFLCAATHCDATGCMLVDVGGVHINSGVPNRAYSLMTDGGFLNDEEVTGIGLGRAARIHYRALAHYLPSGATFLHHRSALLQSCSDLIGSGGITNQTCAEVAAALRAVQMATQPCGLTPRAPRCDSGEELVSLYLEDIDSTGAAAWLQSTTSGPTIWKLTNDFATSGVASFHGQNLNGPAEGYLWMNFNLVLPEKSRLSFDHAWYFSYNAIDGFPYDGGIVEYSTDGGVTWVDAGALIDAGPGYNGVITDCCNSPIPGRSVFGGESHGYTRTRLDLSALAGKSTRFRFRLANDQVVGGYGWYIDDVHLYACLPALSGDDSYVDPDGVCGGHQNCHQTVQSAMDAANHGDTLHVRAASFVESVDLAAADATILQLDPGWNSSFTARSDAIFVLGPNGGADSTVQSLTIRGGSLRLSG